MIKFVLIIPPPISYKFNNNFLNNAESLIYCITSFFSLKCNSLKDNVDLIMRKLGFEKVTTIDMLLEKLGLEEDEDVNKVFHNMG